MCVYSIEREMYDDIKTIIMFKYDQRGKPIKEKSIDKYITDVKKIQSLLAFPKGEGAVSDLSFLYRVDDVVSVIENMRGRKRDTETGEKVFLSNNTKRNYYQSCVSVLDGMDDYTVLDKYVKLVNNLNTLYKHTNKIAQTEVTQKSEDSLISYEQLKNIVNESDELVRQLRIDKGHNPKFLETDALEFLNDLQTNIFLNLYLEIPARNEFATLKFINYEKTIKPKFQYDKETNYFVKRLEKDGPSFLVINQYKTAGLYDARTIDVSKKVRSVIMYYWTIVNRMIGSKGSGSDGTKSLFYSRFYNKVQDSGDIDRWIDSPMTSNKLSKYLARFFMRTIDKPLSTTAIAKIVNSHQNKAHMEAIQKNSVNRGTSIGTLSEVYMPMLPQ